MAVPADRCGYTYPEGHDVGAEPAHQHCCYRETLSDTDRCAWHAHPETTDEKTVAALSAARVPAAVREETEPVGELLDGAILTGMALGDAVSFENTAIRHGEFTDAGLGGASFTNAFGMHADFTDAKAGKTDFSGANLTAADFTNADLGGSDFSDATLTDATLTSAFGRHADLVNASLQNATCPDADLSFTDLTDADLARVECTDVNLGFATLVDTTLIGATLVRGSLQNADLTGATLRDADLTDATFDTADLSDTMLAGITTVDAPVLDGTTFANADLQTATLPAGETLQDAILDEAQLQGQDLSDANLAGASLAKADLTDVDLSGADLSGANLERALLNRADLFNVRFSGARLEGAAFGNVQINERTFEQLAPATNIDGEPRGLLTRCKRLCYGPTGRDEIRCVYDPKSPYDHASAVTAQSGDQDAPEVRAGGVYRTFERLAATNALPRWQRRFFILRQDMQTRQYRLEGARLHHWFAVIQRSVFGYGESFSRVVGWSAVIVLVFALLYLISGGIYPIQPGGGLGEPITWTRLPDAPSVVWDSIYYSTLTFTALGFGDFLPNGTFGQLLTIAETATGATLLALLVFVLGRRAAR